MQINIPNAQYQTFIFVVLFFTAVILTTRHNPRESFFAYSRTEELKGFAILAIIFSHIGYFLSTNPQFLYPLSILAGVGVNLFLFLSGFGLTTSILKHTTTPLSFYKKRLTKLLFPMWAVMTLFILMDLFLLQRNYPAITIIQSYFGFFPRADIFLDLNSPLWYFSLIFLYYLIFPLFFWKKSIYLAPILLLTAPFFLLKQELPINTNVISLYKLHFASFPLGVFFALLTHDQLFLHSKNLIKNVFFLSNLKYILIPFFLAVFVYTSLNSGVGVSKTMEQTISLITMFSIIFIFIIKPLEFKLFNLFGKYSYEIYLIHWPLLVRYDLFYKYLPASFATLVYLGFFLILGFLMKKLSSKYL